ncbi:MAG: hypothetical protein M1829_005231 [Trizodia sp. TS-e1964]|nr:MAG: hypothetical protein M1829_005231 [Trizodia sp. TS-e1964]
MRNLCLPIDFIAQEISWYLEDYAQLNPFETERAGEARDALLNEAKYLAASIKATNLLIMDGPNRYIFLEIEDSPLMPSSFPWEALERIDIWPVSLNLDVVIVVRTSPEATLKSTAASGHQKDSPGKFNVLVVSARSGLENDISDKLAATEIMGALDTIAGMEARIKDITTVHTLHPGTFEALKAQLDVSLGFYQKSFSSGSLQSVPDYRSATDIGQLLAQYGVNSVVLNACRSTHQSGERETLPRILKSYGVTEIVAMSHKVSSRGVQYFLAAFYLLLFSCRSYPLAAWVARSFMLDHPNRLTRFGASVNIMDHIVPIFYGLPDSMDLNDSSIRHICSGASASSDDDDSSLSWAGFGRDSDLLRLECMLLEGRRPALLVGSPGIEKTVLINSLWNWWKLGGFMIDSYLVQLSQYKSFTFDKFYRDLHKYFHLEEPYNSSKEVISFLQSTRCLLVFDSLESMAVDPSTTISKQRAELLRLLRALRGTETIVILSSRCEYKFLSAYTYSYHLQGLGTVPALRLMRLCLKQSQQTVPRSRDFDMTPVWQMLGLSEADPVLQEAQKVLKRTDSGLKALYATWNTEEDSLYLEEIHKLVEGHPLAILMAISSLTVLGPDVTPKQFMAQLLTATPLLSIFSFIMQNYGDAEGLRCLKEMDQMMEDLSQSNLYTHGVVRGYFAAFWRVIPSRHLSAFNKFQTREWNILKRKNGTSNFSNVLATLQELKSQGAVQNMPANLQQLIPILEELTIKASKTDPADDALARTILTHESDFMFPYIQRGLAKNPSIEQKSKDKLKSFNGWTDVLGELHKNSAESTTAPLSALNEVMSINAAAHDDALQALKSAYLIEPVPNELLPPGMEDIGYHKISPILTLYLRTQSSWAEDEDMRESHKTGLALLYAHRCNSWPVLQFHKTDQWVSIKTQAGMEFYNIASAALIGLEYIRDGK